MEDISVRAICDLHISSKSVVFSRGKHTKKSRLLLAQYLPLGGANATIVGLLCAMGLWLFAPQTAVAQNPVQRDPQALTILAQTITAGGGQELLASIQDFTETGTITYYWADQITGDVTIEGRGLHQFKVVADLPKGRRITVAGSEGGSLTEANGSVRSIPHQSAVGLGNLTLPCVLLSAAAQDPSMSVVYGGLVDHNGTQAYDIRLQRVYDTKQKTEQGTKEARDFYIDHSSYMVTAVSDQVHSGASQGDGIPHEILYSNYQSKSGLMTPLTVTETVRGVTTATMNLSQITFNSGLTSTEFTW